MKSINDIVQEEEIPFTLMMTLEMNKKAVIVDTKEFGIYASIDYINLKNQEKVRNYYNLILTEQGKFMFQYGCTVLVNYRR